MLLAGAMFPLLTSLQGFGNNPQTISLLCLLKHNLGIAGPDLIVVPNRPSKIGRASSNNGDVNIIVLTDGRDK